LFPDPNTALCCLQDGDASLVVATYRIVATLNKIK